VIVQLSSPCEGVSLVCRAAIFGRNRYVDAHFAAIFLVFYFCLPIKSVSPIQASTPSMLRCEN
jgi:hypothetical protein